MRDDKLIEAMRESFEAWFSDDWQHPSAVERDAVGYKLAQAQNAWTVWQAAWQAALAALQREWAVVPREPTDAMLNAAALRKGSDDRYIYADIYRAMIAAAPQAEEPL